MEENINQQSPPGPYSELKSFRPYLGKKTPFLIQVVAGLIWLAAAGLLLQGIVSLFFDPIFGVLTLAVGAFAIITGKSLFGMKKRAVQNSIIMAVILVGVALWNIISAKFAGGLSAYRIEIVLILYGVLLTLIVFKYKERFVN